LETIICMSVIFALSFISIFLNKNILLKKFLSAYIFTSILYTIVVGFIPPTSKFFMIYVIGVLIFSGSFTEMILKTIICFAVFLLISFFTHLILRRREEDTYSIIFGIVVGLFMNLTTNILPMFLNIIIYGIR